VVEKLAFDGHTIEEACALFLAAEGNWLARYEAEERARTDFERLWSNFGQPHVEAREAGAAAAKGLTGKKKKRPEAANDNYEHADGDGSAPYLDDAPDAEPQADEYTLEAIADLETLTYPQGAVQDLIDWIVSSAEQPSRVLAMSAALRH
jgi:hypothetical protein